MKIVVSIAILCAAILACGKMDGDVTSDAETDVFSGCTWPNKEGGTIQCPADGKTSCPSGYDCNTCRCNLDATRGGCTTLACP